MNHLPQPVDPAASRHAIRFRAVHRVLAELRRGAPVLLTAPAGDLLVLSAETATRQALDAFAMTTVPPHALLLTAGRAASLLGLPPADSGPPRAFALAPWLADPVALRELADASVEDGIATLSPTATSAPVPLLADAAIAACKLARLLPAAVVGGPLPGAPELDALSVPASDLLAYPAQAGLVRVAEADVALEGVGKARIIAFRPPDGGVEHLAIVLGTARANPPPLVRLHSECFTGDLLGSLRCDCGPQLRQAMARIAESGSGALLYLAQEGRGIGLVNKLRAYRLQDQGLDTLDANLALGWDADERDFAVAAAMLRALAMPRVRLLTNNPAKAAALRACGIEVVEQVAHRIAPNGVDDDYLRTKRERFGHT